MAGADLTLEISVDEYLRRVHLQVRGPMDSPIFVDRQITFYRERRDLIGFDRIIDFEFCQGHVAQPDVTRLALFWSSQRYDIANNISLALITQDAFAIARLPLANLSYPRHTMRAFHSMSEGLVWLDEMRRNPFKERSTG